MGAKPIDLKPLQAKSSPAEAQLVEIFDAAINAEQSAESTAAEIDKLFPAGEDAEAYLWALWTVFFGVVKKLPASDERQELLVKVVEILKTKDRETVTIWGEKSPVWGGLPMMGPCMREAWNIAPKFDGSEQDAVNIAAWTSLNSFSARILGASLQPWANFAIWSLRSALEEPTLSKPNAREANLAVACEWFSHAGEVLHAKSREGKRLEEAEAKSLRTGKSLEAPPGFNEERWTFWRETLAAMGGETEDVELSQRTQKVVETMKSLDG